MARRTSNDVYEAVMALRGELLQQIAQHETRLSVLENGRKHAAEERLKLCAAVEQNTKSIRTMEISQAKSAGIGAIVGALIAVIPQVIQVLR